MQCFQTALAYTCALPLVVIACATQGGDDDDGADTRAAGSETTQDTNTSDGEATDGTADATAETETAGDTAATDVTGNGDETTTNETTGDTGDNGDAAKYPYTKCSPTMACPMGLRCSTVDNMGFFCAPVCLTTEDCPPAPDGAAAAAMCVLAFQPGTQPTHCGLMCNAMANNCPEGMDCVEVHDGAVCQWPA